jgi:hypothetical protein
MMVTIDLIYYKDFTYALVVFINPYVLFSYSIAHNFVEICVK